MKYIPPDISKLTEEQLELYNQILEEEKLEYGYNAPENKDDE